MTAPACAIRITRQGDETITEARVVSQSVDIVCVSLRTDKQFAGIAAGCSTNLDGLPSVFIGYAGSDSWTKVSFPDYANWRVYAADRGGPFRVHVCLVSPSVEG